MGQQEKSAGKQHSVHKAHYSEGPQDTTCSRHAVISHNTQHAQQRYFNSLGDLTKTTVCSNLHTESLETSSRACVLAFSNLNFQVSQKVRLVTDRW